MTIGEALKSIRLNAGLTQTQMAADVVSESFYSKIERGVSEVDANVLIQILDAHHFDVVSFFSRISNQPSRNNGFNYAAKIGFAQNQKDLKTLVKIKKELEAKNDGKIPDVLQNRLELAVAWVKHSNAEVSPEVKARINKMLKNENWDRVSYHYLSQAVILMDIKQAYHWVQSAFHAFKKHPAYDTFTLQFVGLIAINFLNCCSHENGQQYAQVAIDFLRSLPKDYVLGLPNILATYYEALFNRDRKTLNSCLQVLKKSGYLSVVEDTLA